ncbi:MAG: hypothetical protein JOS17DRAFT_813462 [Linnemannia elongata]|nr:MAG: hypothetical protein JOS17DRAFT_813462 [Linnemannia elongata]
MKFLAVTAALVTAAVVTAELPPPENFTDCATTPTQLTLTSFTVSPSPLCLKQQFCYTATGTLNAPLLKGSTISIYGRYLNRLVYTDYLIDLCAALTAGGHTDCNVPAGPVSLKLCRPVRNSFWANVPTQFQTLLTNGDGSIILCQTQRNYAVNC